MKNSNLYQEKKKEWKVVTLETWHENNKTREKYCLKKPLAKQFVSYTVTFLDLGKGERSEWNESSWVPSDSLQPRGLFSPWTSPGQNTGVDSLYCSSGDLPNPGIEHSSPTLQADSLSAEPQGKPKNTGADSLSLFQQTFLTQESNQGLLHCRWILYELSYQGSPRGKETSYQQQPLCHRLYCLWLTDRSQPQVSKGKRGREERPEGEGQKQVHFRQDGGQNTEKAGMVCPQGNLQLMTHFLEIVLGSWFISAQLLFMLLL